MPYVAKDVVIWRRTEDAWTDLTPNQAEQGDRITYDGMRGEIVDIEFDEQSDRLVFVVEQTEPHDAQKLVACPLHYN